MAVLPANFSRVPTLLSSQLILSNITRNNLDLFGIQQQISSGKRINRPSDDPVAAAMIASIKDRLGLGAQRLLNLDHASLVLGTLDTALTDTTDLVREAQTIAISQIGLTSDPATRQQQAVVVDSMLANLKNIANRSVAGLYVFGGDTPTTQPVEDFLGGVRFRSRGQGMITDLGSGDSIRITTGGNNAIGETSARLRSTVPLNPSLTLTTPVGDLRGARGQGVALGTITFSVGGGAPVNVDLAGSTSLSDIANRITTAVRAYETTNSVTVLGPGGVGVSGPSLSFDMAAGATLTFGETANGITAADLGLTGISFATGTTLGAGLDPMLRMSTRLADIPALTLPLGTIRVKLTQGFASAGPASGTVIRDIDLSTADTIDDIRSLLESANLGVRVQIGESGRSLDILNEISGPSLSIEETAGNGLTASQLGIRTLDWSTLMSEFNDGRGVRIVHGSTNPTTGLPDPARDVDFRITLGNGQAFDVDLRPQDMTNVQTVIQRINDQFNTAIGQPPINGSAPALAAGQFIARLTDGPNGIALTQTIPGGAITVQKRNNSDAADDLGLSSGSWDPLSATLIAQDRAAIRVDNLFTHLIDLAAALRTNDNAGIAFAGGQIQKAADRLSVAQALTGSASQRVDQLKVQLTEQNTLDEQLRTQLEDVDYYEAISRFNLLQTQLEASLRASAQIASTRTLLDFLT